MATLDELLAQVAPAGSGVQPDTSDLDTLLEKVRPDGPTTGQKVVNDTVSTIGGSWEGLAQGLGMPADLIAEGINKLLPSEQEIQEPFGGSTLIQRGLQRTSDAVRDGFNYLLPDDQELQHGPFPMEAEPMTGIGRVTRGAAEATGETAGAMAWGGAASPMLRSGGLAKGVVDDALVRAPVAQLGFGASAGAGAALGGMVSGDHPMGQLLGGLAGGLLPAGMIGAARGTWNAATGLYDDLSRSGAETKAGEILREAASDPEAALAKLKAWNPDETLSGMQTTGQATGDPGLAGLEANKAAMPGAGGQIAQRYGQQDAAIRQGVDQGFPPQAGPQDVARMLQEEHARRLGAVQGSRDAIGTGQPADVLGQRLREQLEEARGSAEMRRDAAATPLRDEALASDALVDVGSVVQAIDSAMASAKRPAVRKALEGARRSLQKLDGQGSFTDEFDTSVSGLYEARKTINDLIAGRGETGTERYAQAELLAIRDQLDAAIQQAEPKFGEYMDAYRTRSRDLDPFNEGVVGKVLKTDRASGQYQVADAGVLSQFVRPGDLGAETADALRRMNVGEDEVMDHFARLLNEQVAGSNGKLDPKRWRTILRRYGPFLARFPEVRERMTNLADAQAMVDDLTDSINLPASVRETGVAEYLLQDNLDRVVKRVLKDDNPVAAYDHLAKILGDEPRAIRGLRRAVAEHILNSISNSARRTDGQEVLSTKKTLDLLKQPGVRNLIQERFTANQRRILDQLQNEMVGRSVASGPRRTTGSDTAPNQVFQTLLKRWAIPGLGDVGNFMLDSVPGLPGLATGSRVAREGARLYGTNRAQQVVLEALLDPRLAAKVMEAPSRERDEYLTKLLMAKGLIGSTLAGTELEP